jgi:hypothetical protein
MIPALGRDFRSRLSELWVAGSGTETKRLHISPSPLGRTFPLLDDFWLLNNFWLHERDGMLISLFDRFCEVTSTGTENPSVAQ